MGQRTHRCREHAKNAKGSLECRVRGLKYSKLQTPKDFKFAAPKRTSVHHLGFATGFLSTFQITSKITVLLPEFSHMYNKD